MHDYYEINIKNAYCYVWFNKRFSSSFAFIV
jgi:hypothetical protein